MWWTQTPIVLLDINPSFMLWFMSTPPGLTGRLTRLQIWQQINGTDGQSDQHHLPCFFSVLELPKSTWHNTANRKSFFSLHTMSSQWVSSLTALNPTSPPLLRANWLKPEWVPSGGLVLSVFHKPAPTGSYSTLSGMDWSWNNLLVKQ